jgi:DNA polymerase/3'-5' exonuclease PolX
VIKKSIDVDAAMKLLRKRTTTVDDVCKFIYKDITEYQDSREIFYLEELKKEVQSNKKLPTEDITEKVAEDIVLKIEKDVKKFTLEYAGTSLDCVLDAINEKRFRSKKNLELLLTLLSSLKEINEEI